MENNTIILTKVLKMRNGEEFKKWLQQYQLNLLKKGLKENTVYIKMKQLSDFLLFLEDFHSNIKNRNKYNMSNMSELAFKYVNEGYFTTEDMEGSLNYRKQIYSNIREGINFIFEDIKGVKGIEVINKLSDEQIDTLDLISKNNWYRCYGQRDEVGVNDSIQTQLIKSLGLKVYFDEDNEPYVLSNELADMIRKNHKDLLKSLRDIKAKVADLQRGKKSPVEATIDMTMFEDFYEVDKKVGNNTGKEKRICYRLKKDLLFLYVLGLNGDKYFKFKVDYISAFNYIEQEYKELLIKHGELKENFIKVYNELRKENRDYYINSLK